MESAGKIAALTLSAMAVISCRTVIPVTLAEITPMPREIVIQEEPEYEPVFSVMKILEISEVNGVQKHIIAKIEADGQDIRVDDLGEVSADVSFEEPLGIIRVIDRTGGFLRCSVESSTHKIPANSYIRIQVGQKEKSAEGKKE